MLKKLHRGSYRKHLSTQSTVIEHLLYAWVVPRPWGKTGSGRQATATGKVARSSLGRRREGPQGESALRSWRHRLARLRGRGAEGWQRGGFHLGQEQLS